MALLLTAFAEEPAEPSPEALFEAHTLELRQVISGYEVVRGGEALTAEQFAGLVGDSAGLTRLQHARRRKHSLVLGTMAASAAAIGAGSLALVDGSPSTARAGGVAVIGGVGLYGLGAHLLLRRDARVERVDTHYGATEVQAWVERHDRAVQAQLGIEVVEEPEDAR
ncbi:MAG: hypothetical protein EP330_13070 [Deltaproteobacteria bacterium]|nr:MAG: hypothetical protein EP330_13070 [Deltaproteobacteria bacterium]